MCEFQLTTLSAQLGCDNYIITFLVSFVTLNKRHRKSYSIKLKLLALVDVSATNFFKHESMKLQAHLHAAVGNYNTAVSTVCCFCQVINFCKSRYNHRTVLQQVLLRQKEVTAPIRAGPNATIFYDSLLSKTLWGKGLQ